MMPFNQRAQPKALSVSVGPSLRKGPHQAENIFLHNKAGTLISQEVVLKSCC